MKAPVVKRNEIDGHVLSHAPVRTGYLTSEHPKQLAQILNLHCTTIMSDDEEQYNVCFSL